MATRGMISGHRPHAGPAVGHQHRLSRQLGQSLIWDVLIFHLPQNRYLHELFRRLASTRPRRGFPSANTRCNAESSWLIDRCAGAVDPRRLTLISPCVTLDRSGPSFRKIRVLGERIPDFGIVDQSLAANPA